nr:unnamed protein product [Callosobruchus analis]
MGNAVLLGDRGYGLESYLLTPLDNPQNQTRNIVEQVFGIWKRRFPILSVGIRSRVPLAQMIIVASAVLHNIAMQHNEADF